MGIIPEVQLFNVCFFSNQPVRNSNFLQILWIERLRYDQVFATYTYVYVYLYMYVITFYVVQRGMAADRHGWRLLEYMCRMHLLLTPWIIHNVRTLLCCLLVEYRSITPYPSVSLWWHWDNQCLIVPMPVRQCKRTHIDQLRTFHITSTTKRVRILWNKLRMN